MTEITPLKESEIDDFLEVFVEAYPDDEREDTEGLVKYLKRSLSEDKHIEYFKASIGKEIVGTLRFLNYEMNMRNKMVPAKGLGLVAVSSLHRKKGVAKSMMEFYISESDKAGVDFLILYPFNLAFYRKTGFGYGTKQRMYKLLPSSFPSYTPSNLTYMKKEEAPQVLDCFNEYATQNNGMIIRKEGAFDGSLDSPGKKILLYKENDKILGYMAYHYKTEKPDYEYDCNLIISELIYNNKEALHSFIGFIHNQREQAVRIHFNTQDESLFFLLDNPLNGEKETFKTEQLESYTTALSMMYRISNVKRLFTRYSDVKFSDDDFIVKLSIQDTLYSPNNSSTIIRFQNGYPVVEQENSSWDVELSMDISDFSSLFAGAVSLRKLVKLGLAEISDGAWLNKADRTLSYHEKPQCFTSF